MKKAKAPDILDLLREERKDLREQWNESLIAALEGAISEIERLREDLEFEHQQKAGASI